MRDWNSITYASFISQVNIWNCLACIDIHANPSSVYCAPSGQLLTTRTCFTAILKLATVSESEKKKIFEPVNDVTWMGKLYTRDVGFICCYLNIHDGTRGTETNTERPTE